MNWASIRYFALEAAVCIAVAFILSCASTPLSVPPATGPGPNTDFKYDLTGDINGTPFDGVGVIPLAKSYVLHVKSDVDVDLMKITTCHRDWDDQDHPIQDDWFKPKRQFTFEFTQADGIENLGTCLLRIGAYNKSGNPQAWATLDFQTPESTLPAFQKCNGAQGNTGGVSVCQSLVGLDEEIDFDMPVEVSSMIMPQCKPHPPKDQKHWLYTLAQGECVVYYQEIAPPHRLHRHTSVGYKQIQLKPN